MSAKSSSPLVVGVALYAACPFSWGAGCAAATAVSTLGGGVAAEVAAASDEKAAASMEVAEATTEALAGTTEASIEATGNVGTAIESRWAQVPDNGFLGGWSQTETLQPGTIVDRFGSEAGSFFSPAGTAIEARALPTLESQLSTYVVLDPLEVQGGIVAPAFGQSGLGVQYMASRTVADLIESGLIERVMQ